MYKYRVRAKRNKVKRVKEVYMKKIRKKGKLKERVHRSNKPDTTRDSGEIHTNIY